MIDACGRDSECGGAPLPPGVTSPRPSGSKGVDKVIVRSVGRRVRIIGDQVLDGALVTVEVLSTELGLPARIETTLRNDGNSVNWSASSVDLDVSPGATFDMPTAR